MLLQDQLLQITKQYHQNQIPNPHKKLKAALLVVREITEKVETGERQKQTFQKINDLN